MNPADLSAALLTVVSGIVVRRGGTAGLTVDDVALERPRNRDHGDWASNIAMKLAKSLGANPRELAQEIADAAAELEGVASVDVAGPGFINITLDSASAAAVVDKVLADGAGYGKNAHLGGKTLNLEFVSANPTGPIHIGGTRWAAVGDSMARVLEANGAKVVREYYFNDHGEQINRFAKSLVAAAHGEETPID